MYKAFKAALCAVASITATAAHAEWWEAKTNHFVVYSEGDEQEVRTFASKLERFDMALRTLQNMPSAPIPESAKVTLFRFGKTSDIGQLAGSQGVAGFYIPRAASPVGFFPRKEDPRAFYEKVDDRTKLDAHTVMQHEYTHHFMLRNFSAAYPSWYIEGFAEANATIELNDDGSFLVGKPPNYRGPMLMSGEYIHVRNLLNPRYKFDSGYDFMSRYTIGWLLTHYLTFGKDRPGQLVAYLKAVNDGEDDLEAAKRIFGDLNKLHADLNRYKTTRLGGAVVRPAGYVPPTVTMRKVPAAEEKLMRDRMVLMRGVTRSKARSMAPGLTATSLAEPGNLLAQQLAAEVNIDARNFAEATAAADRALAINPNDVTSLVYKARALFEAKEGPATRFDEARRLLVRARNADKDHPLPLIEFYNSYRRQGVSPTAQAVLALESAFELASHDRGYRMLLTKQLLDENRVAPAKQVLGPLAFSYDGSDPKKNIPKLVWDMIDTNDIAGARAKLAKELAKYDGEDEDKGD